VRRLGALEMDADIILFLRRDWNATRKVGDNDVDEYITDVFSVKNRNGPYGVARISFRPKYMRFVPFVWYH
jgi:replicative DNA helicase